MEINKCCTQRVIYLIIIMNCFIYIFIYIVTRFNLSLPLFNYVYLVCYEIESISGTKFDFGIAEIQKFPHRYILFYFYPRQTFSSRQLSYKDNKVSYKWSVLGRTRNF